MNGHQNEAFSCLTGALKSPRKVNGYGADYAPKMNLKEKINKLNVDAMTTEELYALWGTTEDEQNAKMDQLVRQMNFKARAEIGRIRNERMLQVKRLLKKDCVAGMPLMATLQTRYPAMCFRNLDQLTDEQIAQIAEDVDILEMLEKEDEQSK